MNRSGGSKRSRCYGSASAFTNARTRGSVFVAVSISAAEGGGTFVGPQDWLAKPGTVGKPFHPELLKIYDADGNTVAPNEIGHLPRGVGEALFELGRFVADDRRQTLPGLLRVLQQIVRAAPLRRAKRAE